MRIIVQIGVSREERDGNEGPARLVSRAGNTSFTKGRRLAVTFRRKMGLIKHAILRNEAKLRKMTIIATCFISASYKKVCRRILQRSKKTKPILCICVFRLPVCDCGDPPLTIFLNEGFQSKDAKRKSHNGHKSLKTFCASLRQ